MELDIKKIKVALRCFSSPPNSCNCQDCYFETKGLCEQNCTTELADVVLSLIKELTEENERLKNICESYMLQYGTATDKEAFLKGERADTVRKMHSLIKERCIAGGIYPAFVASTIEKVAKELLGGD